MKTVASCFHRSALIAALSAGLASGLLALAPAALAQDQVTLHPADENVRGPRDAALEAARDGDYLAARDLARKAAAAGQPLDAEQVDYIGRQAERQEKLAADDAKLKADQVAAAAQVVKIEKQRKSTETAQQDQACWDLKGGADRLNAAVDHGFADSTGNGGMSTKFKTPDRARCPN